jgi:hypothetical protein
VELLGGRRVLAPDLLDDVDHWVPVHNPDRLNQLLLGVPGDNLIRVVARARLPI